jgi:hypothetical protein
MAVFGKSGSVIHPFEADRGVSWTADMISIFPRPTVLSLGLCGVEAAEGGHEIFSSTLVTASGSFGASQVFR